MPEALRVSYRGFVETGTLAYPLYEVVDETDTVYLFERLLSGGRAGSPDVPAVATYAAGEHRLVLKCILEPDNTNECTLVRYAARHLERAWFVPARVALAGRAPPPGARPGDGHYTVVVMPYAGRSLCSELPMAPDAVAETLRWTARACADMCELKLFYTDLKSANLLRTPHGLRFCDYGALTHEQEGCAATATYPPPQHPRGVNLPPTEETVAHSLGALLVALLLPKAAHGLGFVCREEAPVDEAVARLTGAHERALAAVERADAGMARILAAAWAPGATTADVQDALAARAQERRTGVCC